MFLPQIGSGSKQVDTYDKPRLKWVGATYTISQNVSYYILYICCCITLCRELDLVVQNEVHQFVYTCDMTLHYFYARQDQHNARQGDLTCHSSYWDANYGVLFLGFHNTNQHVYYNEIGLCGHNIDIILGPTLNPMRRVYVKTKRACKSLVLDFVCWQLHYVKKIIIAN